MLEKSLEAPLLEAVLLEAVLVALCAGSKPLATASIICCSWVTRAAAADASFVSVAPVAPIAGTLTLRRPGTR
jgi:hypothetical protein